ncbi:hypothetical protein [Streptomyces fuscichromogenes]|uniref:Uncharacterized protein n=1 Tax=Streptomyces fuscichromogenes TaxID=1324013 RepID=A0A917XPE6_9ACTN|nr:hypothetical protein [Streptomyces fuscichromogenes]GGN46353.1 hypothetical protein GCM10011578_099200 [Streptomyces fuscichromogenes]
MPGAFDDDPHDDALRPKGLLGSGLPAALQEANVVVRAPVGTTLDSIPAPRPPAGEGDLTAEEEQALRACVAGMDNLHKAFWIAGKSLETMSAGNLHRNSGHPNFAEYVWVKWEISESQVYRLMDEWRIGEALSQLGWSPRESHIRQLVDIKNSTGTKAAVAVYDAVARTGKRVTANLLAEVTRQLPPLSSEASSGEIGDLVRGVMAPRPTSAAPTADAELTGEGSGEQGVQRSSNSADGTVHTITSVGGDGNSPNGESSRQPSSANGSTSVSDDLSRLNDTLALVREAARTITKPAVRRALEQNPQTVQAVLDEINTNLNKVGRAIAVQRPS